MMNKLQSARAHLLKFLFVLPLLAVTLLAFRGQQLKKQEAVPSQGSGPSAYDTLPKPPAVKKKQTAKDGKEVYDKQKAYEKEKEVYEKQKAVYEKTEKAAYDKQKAIEKTEEKAAYLKQKAIEEKAAYDKQKTAEKTEEKAAYLKQRAIEEQAAYEKQKALYEKEEKAAFEKQKAMFEKEKEAFEKQKAAYEKERTMYKKKYGELPLPTSSTFDIDTLIIKQVAGTRANGQDLLYVVDGKVLASPAALSMLDNQWVTHVDDLEGKEATDRYGDKAANGVLLITTANGNIKEIRNEGEKKIMDLFNRALLIVNGKEVAKSDILRILSHPPKSISMYTSYNAVEKYGDKGKNGVIVFTLDQ